ncbi:hypothetical protein ACFL6S_12340, partial [Candidatus Poribacteria bacterium]
FYSVATMIKWYHFILANISRLLNARYKYGMVLIGLALLRKSDAKDAATSDDEDIYSRILEVTKAISPVLLPMISSLGDLEIEDTPTILHEPSSVYRKQSPSDATQLLMDGLS